MKRPNWIAALCAAAGGLALIMIGTNPTVGYTSVIAYFGGAIFLLSAIILWISNHRQ